MVDAQGATDHDWCSIQESIQQCSTCLSEAAFVHVFPSDGRPPSPRQRGSLLLVSEAPPEVGGFWRLPRPKQKPDDLRENVLELLQLYGLPRVEAHIPRAFEVFLSRGFFLVQALKWPLARQANRRAGFNQLPRKTKALVVKHALGHFLAELTIVRPRGILAMGNAALEMCRCLDERGLMPQGGVEIARLANSRQLEIRVEGGAIPVDVTLLPVDENMRKAKRAALIKDDFKHFLVRHRWTPVASHR